MPRELSLNYVRTSHMPQTAGRLASEKRTVILLDVIHFQGFFGLCMTGRS
jgi:hypothetical protein